MEYLDEVVYGEDSSVTRLYEDIDAIFVDQLFDGVGGEWASTFPNSSWVLAPDANGEFGRTGRSERTPQRLGGTSQTESRHDNRTKLD